MSNAERVFWDDQLPLNQQDLIANLLSDIIGRYSPASMIVNKIAGHKHINTRREEEDRLRGRMGSKGSAPGPSIDAYDRLLVRKSFAAFLSLLEFSQGPPPPNMTHPKFFGLQIF